MQNLTHSPTNPVLKLPITSQSAQVAVRFARQQVLAHKREQVYWNTLSVCAVNDYLKILGFETDLDAGDSWNPIARSLSNTADLEVVGVGRLECRPMHLHEQTCTIPPEVWSDRIGYVMTQLYPEDRTIAILGFVPQPCEMVAMSQLRSPIELVDYLHHWGEAANPSVVRLDHWLQGIFETGWESIEALLNPPQLAFRMLAGGTAIDRAKLLNLGMQLAGTPVVLLVELVQEPQDSSNLTENSRVRIRLQVHPAHEPYLPPDLRLLVLDETGAEFLGTRSRDFDNIIQLQFFGNPGESFTVSVGLGNASVIEKFVI